MKNKHTIEIKKRKKEKSEKERKRRVGSQYRVLTSYQQHMVTPGRPNSVLSKCTFQNSSPYANLSQVKPIKLIYKKSYERDRSKRAHKQTKQDKKTLSVHSGNNVVCHKTCHCTNDPASHSSNLRSSRTNRCLTITPKHASILPPT